MLSLHMELKQRRRRPKDLLGPSHRYFPAPSRYRLFTDVNNPKPRENRSDLQKVQTTQADKHETLILTQERSRPEYRRILPLIRPVSPIMRKCRTSLAESFIVPTPNGQTTSSCQFPRSPSLPCSSEILRPSFHQSARPHQPHFHQSIPFFRFPTTEKPGPKSQKILQTPQNAQEKKFFISQISLHSLLQCTPQRLVFGFLSRVFSHMHTDSLKRGRM